ncbi:MAG: cobalamin-binding protein [Nitrosopumilales archaeon]|jgi:5-methyltetrahydrofolate--homocysteine methyltransferase|nr:cobalamin-binding protein [Nitrosopumilales archaeon]|tara:strand:- start:889 stop:1518 length:630 start_codon:yes stop_codon:yes gene_type:complete
MDHLDNIYEAILDGDMKIVPTNVQSALDAGISVSDILMEGMIVAMEEVGRLFEEGEYFVPEMLLAARAMKAGLSVLQPHLVDSGVEPIGKVVLGTVEGDMHDIGKNLVAMMLEGAGFQIVDLGTDVNAAQFIDAVKEGVDILGLSALLTTTLPSMESTIRAIEAAGLRENVKIIVGGAPVTADYAHQIGADGYAKDASRAVKIAKSFIN